MAGCLHSEVIIIYADIQMCYFDIAIAETKSQQNGVPLVIPSVLAIAPLAWPMGGPVSILLSLHSLSWLRL